MEKHSFQIEELCCMMSGAGRVSAVGLDGAASAAMLAAR